MVPDNDSSGSITTTLRLPTSLRERLDGLAARAHRSLNAEVVARLRESVERRRDSAEGLIEALALPKVVRMSSTSSTSADSARLLLVADELGAESLLLAARPNSLNNCVLTVVIETPGITCLMDGSWLNMARDPRISEIERLFRRFDEMGLLRASRACTRLVSETEHMSPEQALSSIVRDGHPGPLDLGLFLNLLAKTWPVTDLSPYRAAAM